MTRYAKPLIVVMTAFLAPSGRSLATTCFQVLQVQCPGCTPANPGACGCTKQGMECKCTQQGSFRVECEVGNFDYDVGLYAIQAGDEILCSTTFKCMKSDGSTSPCGTLRGSLCVQAPDVCQWRPFGNPYMRFTWVQGALCDEG